MYYIFVFVAAAFLIGFIIGYARRITLMDGDICVITDKVDDQHYIYLRLANEDDILTKKEFVKFRVVRKNVSDSNRE